MSALVRVLWLLAALLAASAGVLSISGLQFGLHPVVFLWASELWEAKWTDGGFVLDNRPEIEQLCAEARILNVYRGEGFRAEYRAWSEGATYLRGRALLEQARQREDAILGPRLRGFQEKEYRLPNRRLYLMAFEFSCLWASCTLWTALARQYRRHQGRCMVCGYDLRASPHRCPECATDVSSSARTAPNA